MSINLFKSIVGLLLFLLSFQVSIAADRDSIVWISDKASLTAISKIELYPISDITNKTFENPPASEVIEVIKKTLETAGISVIYKARGEEPTQLALKTYLVYFNPGSIGGRGGDRPCAGA